MAGLNFPAESCFPDWTGNGKKTENRMNSARTEGRGGCRMNSAGNRMNSADRNGKSPEPRIFRPGNLTLVHGRLLSPATYLFSEEVTSFFGDTAQPQAPSSILHLL
jgi:hypothetical protein